MICLQKHTTLSETSLTFPLLCFARQIKLNNSAKPTSCNSITSKHIATPIHSSDSESFTGGAIVFISAANTSSYKTLTLSNATISSNGMILLKDIIAPFKDGVALLNNVIAKIDDIIIPFKHVVIPFKHVATSLKHIMKSLKNVMTPFDNIVTLFKMFAAKIEAVLRNANSLKSIKFLKFVKLKIVFSLWISVNSANSVLK